MELGSFGKPTRYSPIRPLTEMKLVEAASRLFLTEPIDNISVERIAAGAGLSRRTAYNVRESRGDLIKWVIDKLIEGILSRLPKAFPDSPIEIALYEYFEPIVLTFNDEAHQRLWSVIAKNRVSHPWIHTTYKKRIYSPLIGALRDGLIDAGATRTLDIPAAVVLSAHAYSATLSLFVKHYADDISATRDNALIDIERLDSFLRWYSLDLIV